MNGKVNKSSKNKKAPATAIARAMSNPTSKKGNNMTNVTNNQLAFHDTEFNAVTHKSKVWLTAPDLAKALQYKQPHAVSQIYSRNADEFSQGMTETLNLSVSGNLMKEVRVFSLRGAHLVAMFSKTKVAKEFRKWVLDVLDNQVANLPPELKTTKALPSGLTLDQQSAIKGMVAARVEKLPEHCRAKGAIRCWSSLKSKFGCTYKEIASEQFTEAVSLVARLELEGELLPKETPPTAPVQMQLDYPMSDWIKRCLHPSVTPIESSPGRYRILPTHIGSGDSWSPTSYLIAELTRHGYEAAAIRLEHLAMRHYMEWMGITLWQIRLLAQNCNDAETMKRSLMAIESRANTRNLPPLVLPA